MNGYFYPQREEGDRADLQRALDSAERLGRGTVVLSGDWTLDGTVYIGENTTLLLEGATLRGTGGDFPLITNSNRARPRGKTLFGTQRGISILGSGEVFGRIDLVNVEDFTLSALSFTGQDSGVILSYATGGRLTSLAFSGSDCCILAGIGTRNCFFSDISTKGERRSLVFCSDRMSDRVVNYFGPDVKNNVVRGLCASAEVEILGDYCRDILVC